MGNASTLPPLPFRFTGFDHGRDDCTALVEVSASPSGVVTIERVDPWRAVVDLRPGEYKDVSDGRSAGDPSGGE